MVDSKIAPTAAPATEQVGSAPTATYYRVHVLQAAPKTQRPDIFPRPRPQVELTRATSCN